MRRGSELKSRNSLRGSSTISISGGNKLDVSLHLRFHLTLKALLDLLFLHHIPRSWTTDDRFWAWRPAQYQRTAILFPRMSASLHQFGHTPTSLHTPWLAIIANQLSYSLQCSSAFSKAILFTVKPIKLVNKGLNFGISLVQWFTSTYVTLNFVISFTVTFAIYDTFQCCYRQSTLITKPISVTMATIFMMRTKLRPTPILGNTNHMERYSVSLLVIQFCFILQQSLWKTLSHKKK